MDSDDKEEFAREKNELRVHLEREFFERLDIISEYYGIQSRTEIMRFLINKEFRAITEK
jgi:hypothetical protein